MAALGALTWASAVVLAGLGVASLARAGAAREGIAGSVGWWAVVAGAGMVVLAVARGAVAAR